MTSDRVIFAPYRIAKKSKCPGCGKKTFVNFYDKENAIVYKDAGKCDSANSCGYYKHWRDSSHFHIVTKEEISDTRLISIKNTRYNMFLTERFGNHLYIWLRRRFKNNGLDVNTSWREYNLGSTYKMLTVYPFQKSGWSVRCAKCIMYDSNGKRLKSDGEDKNEYTWTDKQAGVRDGVEYIIDWCLFGEVLLNKPWVKDVFIHEGVKNPVVARIVDLVNKKKGRVHLATGSLYYYESINKAAKLLEGKNVYIIPDKGCTDYWKSKITIPGIKYLDFLEKCEEVPNGGDYEDYLRVKGII